jgi:arylsulfatase A-like enzyme
MPHAVGMGIIAEWSTGFPGYRGRVTRQAATLAEVLRDNGYNTLAAGKWHLMPQSDARPPFPSTTGHSSEASIAGTASMARSPTSGTRSCSRTITPSTFRIGPGITSRRTSSIGSIRYVRDQKVNAPDKPFFLYLAFGACH